MIFTRKLLLLIFLLLSLLSCSTKVEEERDDLNLGSFTLERVTATSVENYSSSDLWSDIENVISVNLHSCIKDKAVNDSIVDMPFQIRKLNGKIIDDVVTTNRGCFTWNEQIKFNFMQREGDYLLERYVVGTGIFKGKAKVSITLNPWMKTNSAIKDSLKGEQSYLNSRSVESIMSNAHTLNYRSYIKLDNVEALFVSIDQDSGHVKYNMVFSPKYIRTLKSGAEKYLPLTKGKFDLEYFLIEKYEKTGKREFIAKAFVDGAKIVHGKVTAPVSFELERSILPTSEFEIGVRIIPQDDSVGLGIWEGIGSVDRKEIPGDMDIRLNYLNEEIGNIIDDGQWFADRKIQFSIDELELSPGPFLGTRDDEKRITEVNVDKLCILDPFGLPVKRGRLFSLSIYEKDGEVPTFSEPIKTNRSGCIESKNQTIDYNIEGQYYYKKYIVKVKSVRGSEDLAAISGIEINPSLRDQNFWIDLRFGSSMENSGAVDKRIHFKSFRYRYKGNDEKTGFYTNKRLDLGFHKRYQITIKPTMYIPFKQETGKESFDEPLPTELKYRLRMLILSPKPGSTDRDKINFENFDVVSGAESIVEIGDGEIGTYLSFPMMFEDLIFLAGRSRALIELSPLDEDLEIKKGYLITDFAADKYYRKQDDVRETLGPLSLEDNLQQIDYSKFITTAIDKLNENIKGTKKAGDSIKSSYAHYVQDVQNSDKRLLNEKQLDKILDKALIDFHFSRRMGAISSQSAWDKIFHGDINSLNYMDRARFCKLFSPGLKHYDLQKECTKNPELAIGYKSLKFIEKITSTPEYYNDGEPIFGTIGSGVATFSSRQKSLRKGRSKQDSTAWYLGLDFYPKIFPITGGATEFGRRRTLIDLKSKTNENTYALLKRGLHSVNFSLNYERFSLNFNANYKECAYFKEERNDVIAMFENMRSDKLRKRRSLVICRDVVIKDKPVTESWYYVGNRDIEAGIMVDKHKIEVNTFTTLLRGKNTFDVYSNHLIDEAAKDIDLMRSIKREGLDPSKIALKKLRMFNFGVIINRKD